MGLVIGIDADAERLAWAVFRDGRYHKRGTIERTHGGRRVDTYRGEVERFFERAAEVEAEVWIEDIYLGHAADGKPMVAAFKSLAMVQGELRHIADGWGVAPAFIAPHAWHRTQLTVQRGREAIQAASHERAAALTGGPVDDPHEADAVCIAAHGCGIGAGWAFEPREACAGRV